jgi:FlaA1/EpsC-like NDP-sugar epimerase
MGIRLVYEFLANKRWARFALLTAWYVAAMSLALWVAYQLRFEFGVPEIFLERALGVWGWMLAVKLALLYYSGQYEDSLSYFSAPDLRRILCVCVGAAGVTLWMAHSYGPPFVPPRSVVLIDAVLACGLLCSGRFGIRMLRERFVAPHPGGRRRSRRVGVIGAGETGALLVRELLGKSWMGLQPIAFFDDFRRLGSRVHGIPVWGRPEDLLEEGVSKKLDEVIVAWPTAPACRIRAIASVLQKAQIPFRTIPSMRQLATGAVSVTHLRNLQIEDLLGRETVQLDHANVRKMVSGKKVLITGAGGSIGSELCRQVASFDPELVVLLERSEAAIFPIEQELHERQPGVRLIPMVADILDRPRMEAIFAELQPNLVFHAAAHKHVPMMELQPGEAIRNNIFGTAQVAELAARYHAERFVLVSTDKAINPTNVMGATKRMAERFVQSMQAGAGGRTKFLAVRFGNVLGSSGSVVPIFTRQIAAGGPVKVTHPEVTRYFMTIPEAVSLVLQSAQLAEGGEIFVLDMGKPVKIVDLARQMIELSGLRPGIDIEVLFTGLRPGEKLYEELSHCGENVAPTAESKIMRLVCEPSSLNEMKAHLQTLASGLPGADGASLKLLLRQLVPEYVPDLNPPLSAARGTESLAPTSPAAPASPNVACAFVTG